MPCMHGEYAPAVLLEYAQCKHVVDFSGVKLMFAAVSRTLALSLN